MKHTWTEACLSDGVEIICGQHVLAKNYSRSSGTIPYITGPSDFNNGSIEASRYVSKPGVMCAADDILLTVKGSGVGTLAFADQAYCISRQLMAIRPISWLPRFVFHALTHFSEALNRSSEGTIPGVSKSSIENWRLSVPPLEEQARIVEILDAADAAVRAFDALIAAKTRHKLAQAERLLSGNARFPEFKQQAWRNVCLNEVLVESRIPEKVSNSATRLTVRLHIEGVEARSDKGTEAKGATVYYERKAGQFIYGKQNLSRGAVGIVPSHLAGYSSSQDVPAFDWLNGFEPRFILKYVSRKSFYEDLERLAVGTGSKRIHPASFLDVVIQVPGIEEQRRIADTLDLMEQEITLLRGQRERQQKIKYGLMQQLLTGQTPVKEAMP